MRKKQDTADNAMALRTSACWFFPGWQPRKKNKMLVAHNPDPRAIPVAQTTGEIKKNKK